MSTLPLEKADIPAEMDDTRTPRRVLDQRPLITLLLIVAGVVTVCIGTVLAWFLGLPDIRTVADYRPQVATLVLDRRGRPIDAGGFGPDADERDGAVDVDGCAVNGDGGAGEICQNGRDDP